MKKMVKRMLNATLVLSGIALTLQGGTAHAAVPMAEQIRATIESLQHVDSSVLTGREKASFDAGVAALKKALIAAKGIGPVAFTEEGYAWDSTTITHKCTWAAQDARGLAWAKCYAAGYSACEVATNTKISETDNSCTYRAVVTGRN